MSSVDVDRMNTRMEAIRRALIVLESNLAEVAKEDLSDESSRVLREIRREWRELSIRIADVALWADEILC